MLCCIGTVYSGVPLSFFLCFLDRCEVFFVLFFYRFIGASHGQRTIVRQSAMRQMLMSNKGCEGYHTNLLNSYNQTFFVFRGLFKNFSFSV